MTLPLTAFGGCTEKSGTITTVSKVEFIIPMIVLFFGIRKKHRVAAGCAVTCVFGVNFWDVMVHILRVFRDIEIRRRWVVAIVLHWRICAFWVHIR
jgi:hypothetical protein